MKAVFQGRHGAFSEIAAQRFFGEEVQTIPVDTFLDLHKMVQSGEADYGVIPMENSTAGSVMENYDLLLKYKSAIISEVKLQIDHCLIALKGETVESLTKVISHWQALEQCSRFFEENPQIKKEPFFDTAGAVERIARKQSKGVGGIASAFAAEYYGLEILKNPLANFPGLNFTRFFAIQKEDTPVDVALHTKTSIAFFLKKNMPGALHACLSCFARQNVDLIRIESRPKIGSPWEYVFYADLAGNPQQQPVEQALRDLELMAEVILFGSYSQYLFPARLPTTAEANAAAKSWVSKF
ncbi:MAG: prephenate dehydratase [Fibromonadaceae bacterium]|jgi:prephenate dehydratase|nr:prephenate dehydratase [Fibromonadaceae bacterium]